MAVNILGQLGHIVSPSGDTRCRILHGQVRKFMCPNRLGRIAVAHTAWNTSAVGVLLSCCWQQRPANQRRGYVRLSNDAHGTSNGSQSQSALPLVAQRVQSAVVCTVRASLRVWLLMCSLRERDRFVCRRSIVTSPWMRNIRRMLADRCRMYIGTEHASAAVVLGGNVHLCI